MELVGFMLRWPAYVGAKAPNIGVHPPAGVERWGTSERRRAPAAGDAGRWAARRAGNDAR